MEGSRVEVVGGTGREGSQIERYGNSLFPLLLGYALLCSLNSGLCCCTVEMGLQQCSRRDIPTPPRVVGKVFIGFGSSSVIGYLPVIGSGILH